MGSGIDLIVRADAKKDINRIALYYDNIKDGLGSEFLKKLNAKLLLIRSFPEIGFLGPHNFRKVLLSRFPYAIYYFFESNLIEIEAVWHTSRLDTGWNSRL